MRPLDGKVIIEDLRTGNRQIIDVETVGAKEPQLENYLVRRLVDMDEIDYGKVKERIAARVALH